MKNIKLKQHSIRGLLAVAGLGLFWVGSVQAGTPGRGYSSKQPKPTPIRTQEYRAQTACPTAGCVEFFGPLIRGIGKGG